MTNYHQETDETLFALLKESGEQPFNVLFKRYWDRLLEVAYYKLGSQEEAEDVVQQVFMDIWKNRHQTILKYSFNTYISAALKYSIFARLAGEKKRNVVAIENSESAQLSDDGTRQLLSFNEVRNNLETLVNQLPEKCQMVFRLSRDDGKTTDEIAEEMNISPKTVEAHITKAIKTLRSGLGNDKIPILLLSLHFLKKI